MRTKIVCTIGPSTNTTPVMSALIAAGMSVARLNFSHGDHKTHEENIANLRRAEIEAGKPLAIMADLSGPKIRTGAVAGDLIELRSGGKVSVTAEDIVGDAARISIPFAALTRDVGEGDAILLADGLIELNVEDRKGSDLICRIKSGGELRSRQGVNLPGKTLSVPALTEKDHDDLKFILGQEIDWIALSFVRSPDDINELKKLIAAAGRDITVIAKIEKHEAVSDIEAVIAAADGVMLARGDLGVEIATEKVPVIQKQVISLAERAGKPVIVATQMLESMIHSPRPTRAEANDVANAILDGADAVMLSGETAVGDNPEITVLTMARIGREAESILDWEALLAGRSHWAAGTTGDAISFATCQLALMLNAAAIITSTESGQTARQVSRYRPRATIIAVSPRKDVVRRLMLSRGVEPLEIEAPSNIDEMLDVAVSAARRAGKVKIGDRVVITAGVLVNLPGTTNLIKVEDVG